MKRILIFTALILGYFASLAAQTALNNMADNIVGTYSGMQCDDHFKAKIVKLKDGTYRAQIVWLERDRDAKGDKLHDSKNPDKSLRTTPADRIVLFSGLRYDAKNHRWGDTKIYDPQRGIRAKLVAEFTADGRLRRKGSLMGISESVYWTKIE